MQKKISAGIVYYKNKKAGLLIKTKEGYEFRYNPSYLKDAMAEPISLSMPVTKERYKSQTLFPFFDGILPEGWLLGQISSALKIDSNDKFNLLMHVGRDTVGAVSIVPLTDFPNKKKQTK